MNSSRHVALIPAAGIGARMNAACPKQYLPVAGKPMLVHVLETFAASNRIDHVFLVVSEADGYVDEIMAALRGTTDKITLVRNGGATRQESVLNGLLAMDGHVEKSDWILVHDAARPGLSEELIEKLIDGLQGDQVGGLLALPIVDTLKRAAPGNRAESTVSRDGLWAAQTPQMFRYELLRRALEQCTQVTDEASAVESLGLQPKLIEGSARNFKITLPGDIALAECYLKDKG
ncbi:2-C-methyl-D-erythritol 4-phosphate cytidylyltransferase [Oxalobacteraceae bacterium R-40]|uniref:2-C-methyl-D-erythritol 4-phosphate cytidylyltransferase n=1 Tax=Keguizhuia sedimenti TaxID=3064264 RepID=A0ABU1BRI1_9BURK|nr:2-C-methyl-D-erythritol 4-phosphate cytidylyltransferase [Oxalobacteraceae bacterium R-40]